MTGLQLIEELRKNKETQEIPVIMLTARGFAIEQGQEERLRISQCLSKPFSPKELLRSIEDVILQETAVGKD
jgi:CheY-like chemotaxis protein